MRGGASVVLWLGGLGLVVAACRGEPTRQPALGGSGGASDGGSTTVPTAGHGGASVCEDVREGAIAINGCLHCTALPCQPEETCSATAHSNGPVWSTCRCTNGRFTCWFEPPRYEETGGTGGSGGSPAEGAQDSGVVDASPDVVDASTPEDASAARDSAAP